MTPLERSRAERSRAERSRGLGTRLTTLLPIEGETEEPVNQTGQGVRAIIPVVSAAADELPGDGFPPPQRSPRHPAETPSTSRGSSAEAGSNGLRRDQRIFVGLEILQSLLPVELCAYVHRRRKGSPRVHIRLTEGALRSEDDAFELAESLETLFESGQTGPSIVMGDFFCLAVATTGGSTRGLHVLGRRKSRICARDGLLAERFCRLLSPSLHKRQ